MSTGGSGGAHCSASVRLFAGGFRIRTGGVRRVSFELLDALRQQDVDVRVSAEVDPTDSVTAPADPSLVRRGLGEVSEAFQSITRGDHRLVDHSLYYDLACWVTRSPLVVTAYDMIHERMGTGSKVLRLQKAHAIRRADIVTPISHATADDIRELISPTAEIRVVHLGVGQELLDAPHRIDSERRFILYVGRRHNHKNFALLLRAYRHSPILRSIPLLMAGGTPPTQEEVDEIRGATGRPADHRGMVDDTALAHLYDQALVTVVPSKWEGFGLPVLEAMARSCPVACSKGGSLPEVASGWAHLFDAASHEDCADAIERALMQPATVTAGARDFARGFTWARTAAQYRDIYCELGRYN